MEISGRVAMVTGASRGLGEALAVALAAEGAKVALVAREPGPLEAVARRINERGGQARAFAADVAQKEAVHPLAAQVAAWAGPVDLLVHNASTLGPVPLRPLIDTDCEEVERAFAVNVLGPFRLSKIVAGSMLARGGGLIVHITSDASVMAYPTWGAYGLTKASFDHLARIWAAELEGTGVRLLSVDPGEMDTRMHADAIPDADRSQLGRPADVAGKLLALLRASESVPSGSRVELSGFAVSPAQAHGEAHT
jgi:NAD(P)-dependent dehydrogenase (short-subunit alcohol dehydrogenase family)